jgi:ABC-type amino acid transport substrate-binding protein
MSYDNLMQLLGLAAVALASLGALWLLMRVPSGQRRQAGGLTLGYPPDLFPARELTRGPALLALAATQGRLLSIYQQMPAHSDLAIWVRAFLNELREIMDTAYRVALVTEVYGQPALLDRLIAEVQQIETQVAEQVAQRLLARDGDAQQELLDGRLAALRMCMRELTLVSEVGVRGLPRSPQQPAG